MNQQRRIEDIYSKYDQSRWDTSNYANHIQQNERDRHLIRAIAQLGVDSQSVVLDVGCGFGHISSMLTESSLAPKVAGVELLWDRCLGAHSSGVHVAQIDGNVLPIKSNSVDVVVLSTVLSSVPRDHLPQVMTEVRRVLKPGGSIVVFDMHLPNRNRNVSRISTSILRQNVPLASISRKRLTLAPPLARRMPSVLLNQYPLISKFTPLLSHSLWTLRTTSGEHS